MWGISSAGRAPALHAGGQEFDPLILHHPLQKRETEIVDCKRSERLQKTKGKLRSKFSVRQGAGGERSGAYFGTCASNDEQQRSKTGNWQARDLTLKTE